MAPAGGGNIKVVVRVRPFNGRELDRGARCIVEMRDNQTVLTPPPPDSAAGKNGKDTSQKVFAFDKSYWSFSRDGSGSGAGACSYAEQSHLFEDLGKPLLDNAFEGYNNCIFAYGQTGSGKSYSMIGYGKEVGIIPNICQDIFRRIGDLQQDRSVRCTVEVSYLEIYNERVRDLLNPANKGNLKVREHPSTGPYVEDLAKLAVTSFPEIEHLMDEGNKARTVAATNMNATSSRSHAVFTLMLTQKRHDPETGMEMEKAAKISLVDLAGSERANSTGATGARLKEGAEINRSLSTLGRVIAALADLSTTGKKKGGAGAGAAQVPYRDSVLTWLLKDSLGGNSMTAMIAAISPADINYDETLSTLRYADSAKRIKNHAVVNEDANARMIRELKEELALLRSKLGDGAVGGGVGAAAAAAAAAAGNGFAAEEMYPEGTPLEQQFVTISGSDGTTKRVSKAEIAEQLSQSEKLLQDLNQTWEQKLQKTEEIQKERESALEELGISIEKGFVGLSTPKKTPHLVNLSDDPLLAECLVYNLKPGATVVGNTDTVGGGGSKASDGARTDHQHRTVGIRLNGANILPEHCVFENAADGTVTLTPREGALVMVNGQRIAERKQLHSGYRIILGGFHIFRFNHPMEARAERADRSSGSLLLLRQSITASQLAAGLDRGPGSNSNPNSAASSPRPPGRGGDRDSRPASPGPQQQQQNQQRQDSDWTLARREAAGAILGAVAGTTDQTLASLTDEDLNALLEGVRRERAEREQARGDDDDDESVASSHPPLREKYMSTGTIDNMSLDTALTVPPSPRSGSGRNSAGGEADASETETEAEQNRLEKARMEEAIQQVRKDMQAQIEAQRRRYEERLEQLDPQRRPPQPLPPPPPPASRQLTEPQLGLARRAVRRWRSRHHVRMAEAVLRHAAILKEAQILARELDEAVAFQFAVADDDAVACSSYDMVLSGDSGAIGDDDAALADEPKPCVAVRVVDFGRAVTRLWSVEKLQDRVRQMRQVRQYLDQPEYARHLSPDCPFSEPCMPQFSLVGEVDVPLRAVFDSRVQDLSLDVVSPHTWHVVGIVRLSLEPSAHARAPAGTVRFNVVMHEMVGFAEREGTDVHAQLSMPSTTGGDGQGIPTTSGMDESGGGGGGVTTTQMVRDFDEGPIRFESVHSMSVPLTAAAAPASHPAPTLRVAVFARVSTMHLDKLLSWDAIRDAPAPAAAAAAAARLAESQFHTQERHDLLARISILELGEDGEYGPVEVTQAAELDAGTFQLRQGLQRRITVTVSHSSGDVLPWEDVTAIRVGRVRLMDPAAAASTPGGTRAGGGNADPSLSPSSSSPDDMVALTMPSRPAFRENANGTRSVAAVAQWDSSLHGSPLLDRTTADRYRVCLTVSWEIASSRLAEPMRFSRTVACRILPRRGSGSAASGSASSAASSLFASLFQPAGRVIRSSSAVFTLALRPAPVRAAGDLWRMSSQHGYVKGEERLTDWAPRGVSLVRDYIAAQRRRRIAVDIGVAQNMLRKLQQGRQAAELGLEGGGGADGAAEPVPPPPRHCAVEEDDYRNDDDDDAVAADYADAGNLADHHDNDHDEHGDGPSPPVASENSQTPSPEDGHDNADHQRHTPAQVALLERSLTLWTKYPDPVVRILSAENTSPPPDGVASGSSPDAAASLLLSSSSSSPSSSASPPPLVSTIICVPKNPHLAKGGFMLVPSGDLSTWVKRFVELRPPFLHVHSVDGEEVAVVSLRNSRVDPQPGILALLLHGGGGGPADDETDNHHAGHRSRSQTPAPPQSSHRRTASGKIITTLWTTPADGRPGAGGGGMSRLPERLRSAVFSVYGADNTWLFTARSERDKLEWVRRIDEGGG